MGGTDWMVRFCPYAPADGERMAGMCRMHGSGEEGHVPDFKGVRGRFAKSRDWIVMVKALECQDLDWMDWAWERTVLEFGDYLQIRRYYEELGEDA